MDVEKVVVVILIRGSAKHFCEERKYNKNIYWRKQAQLTCKLKAYIIIYPPPQKKSPSQMFKPNARMISMTADDATMNVISWNPSQNPF